MAAIAAGIKKIVYVLKNPRTDEKGSYKIAEDLCYEAGVELIQIKEVV
jgi:deoxycytidylate deaminase